MPEEKLPREILAFSACALLGGVSIAVIIVFWSNLISLFK